MGVTPLLMGALRRNIREAFATFAEVVRAFVSVDTIPCMEGDSRERIGLFLGETIGEVGQALKLGHTGILQ